MRTLTSDADLSDPARLHGAVELSEALFERHCRTSEVLEQSIDGRPRLLSHQDAGGVPLITKLWWPSGMLGRKSVRRAEQFRSRLDHLAARGIRVPVYRAHGRTAAGVRFVVYERLDGSSLRDLEGAFDLGELAEFVVALHARGVYFRGLHLGNVIARDDGAFGVVDVQDVRLRRRPLGLRMRERNLGILCSHPQDRQYMDNGHWSELVMAYCRRAGMSVAEAAHMREMVAGQVSKRRARRLARREARQQRQGGAMAT